MKKLLLSLGSAGLLGVGSLAMVGSASAASGPYTGTHTSGSPSAYTSSYTPSAANKTAWQGQKSGRSSMQSRLDQAVARGQLTSDQRSAILAEINQLRTSLKATSTGDRRAAAHNMHSQLVSWAQQNGIPAQFVAGFGHQAQTN